MTFHVAALHVYSRYVNEAGKHRGHKPEFL